MDLRSVSASKDVIGDPKNDDSVMQWLERPTVKRFSLWRVGSNPTVSHSNGLKQATHGTLFKSTQL